MKNKLLLIILIGALLLSGIGLFLYIKMHKEPHLEYVAIPEFPIVSNPNTVENTPSQIPGDVLTESTGEIAAYTIYDDVVYYLIAYDFGNYGWYKQISVFRQPLEDGQLQKVIDYESDRLIAVTELFYEEQLGWVAYDEENLLWKYILYDDCVEQTLCEEKTSPDVEEVLKGYRVDADTLDGTTWICDENETYVVWSKWPYLGDGDTSCGSTTNVLNKQTGEVTVIENSEYCEGSLHGQVLYGDRLFFSVYDDVKSYVNEEECFENHYMIDLSNGKEKRLTTNYGTLGTTNSILYDNPKKYEKGICFLSELEEITDGNWKRTYQYMYYMKLE